MRFLYFGDLHERETSPENRKDDFPSTLKAKVDEIRELGYKYQVRAFLQPGDFLDRPKHDASFLSEVVKRWGFGEMQEELFALAKGDIKASDMANSAKRQIPLIGAIGNHELYGNALKSYPKTALHFLEQIGFMHIPSKDKPILFTDEKGFTVAITASHYDNGMDTAERLDDYIVEKKMGDFHIHIVHGYLTNRSLGSLIPHTTVDDIAKKTKADLTISGHDHIGFPLTEVDGKLFVNPGGVVRLSNDLREIQRKPKVLLIDITKEHGVRLEEIELKSAPEGKDVLDRSQIAFKKSMDDKLDKIKSMVEKTKIGQGLSITEIIEAISESERIDENIKNRAVELVSDKMKAIQKVNNGASNYIIQKIVLENFQSHAYSEYELKEGLNVFMGESGSGKSAIQRALAWVYENEGRDARRFIQHGKDYARVSLFLSNGFVVSRIIEKKKGGKNGYEVYNSSDGETTFYNTKSVPIIQELLGFNYLQIDEKRSIPLNFQKQGASWFFIGDGFTDTDRAKIIGSVYQTHFVDAVIKDIENENKKQIIRMKEQKKEIEKKEEEMKRFDYLPTWERIIKEAESRLEKLQVLEEKKERIQTLYETLTEIEEQIKHNEQIIQQLSNLSVLEQRLQDVQQKEEKRLLLANKKQELDLLLQNIQKEQTILHSLEKIEEAQQRTEMLHKKVEEYHRMNETWEKALNLEQELERISKGIKKSEHIVAALKNTPKLETKWEHLRQLVERYNKAVEFYKEMKEIIQKGTAERKLIEILKKENEEDVRAYQELLEKIGTCPLCKSHVTTDTIKRIADSYLITEPKGRVTIGT